MSKQDDNISEEEGDCEKQDEDLDKDDMTVVEKDGKDYTYEDMLESILAQAPGKPMYVVILSAGNDVYGWKKSVYEEQYEDVQVGVAIGHVSDSL